MPQTFCMSTDGPVAITGNQSPSTGWGGRRVRVKTKGKCGLILNRGQSGDAESLAGGCGQQGEWGSGGHSAGEVEGHSH